MVPAELVGTWTGTTEIAKDVQMTVAAVVTTTANFYQADANLQQRLEQKLFEKLLVISITPETDEPGAF